MRHPQSDLLIPVARSGGSRDPEKTRKDVVLHQARNRYVRGQYRTTMRCAEASTYRLSFQYHGEPGGARTRDHRIKSAPTWLVSAPTCNLSESFRIGSAGECTAYRQNGERHGGRRGLDRIRAFIAVLECFIKKTPFSERRKLYQPSASHDHYSRLLIPDMVRRKGSRGGDDCSIWICVSAIFALLSRAPGSQSTIHAQSAPAVAGSARSLSHWPISSHDYRPAGPIQEFP